MDKSTENIITETKGDCDEHKLEIFNNDTTNNNNYKKKNVFIDNLTKLTIFILIWAYFIWATIYYFKTSGVDFDTHSGYGLLVILMIFINFGVIYCYLLKPYILPIIHKTIWKPSVGLLKKIKYGPILFYILFLIAALAFLIYDTSDDRTRLIPLAGLIVYILICFLLSSNKKAIKWRTVLWGLILQFVFGLLTIRWEIGRNIFNNLGDKVNTFLGYAVNSSAFVYGDELVYNQQVFAFQALATIYFLGFMINILYYYGIMQKTVAILGKFLQLTMDTSICESVNSAANIFLGMSEAPLLLKPYLIQLTDSEIHSIMTSGFATVSGTVLAAYISFGANPAHLITASVMSSPAALCISKLMYPETEVVKATVKTVKQTKIEYDSVLDAAAKGAHDAYNIVMGIISSLVAFIAFVYFVNGVLGWMGKLVGFVDTSEIWSVELITGKIFIPISYIMGVPWVDCEKVGQLIGIKTMVNEFVAFQHMSTMSLEPKSKIIATYSICGFSNPGSIGIMISTLGALVPNKRDIITRLVFRAFLGGAIVCFMTACIAAMLIPSDTQI